MLIFSLAFELSLHAGTLLTLGASCAAFTSISTHVPLPPVGLLAEAAKEAAHLTERAVSEPEWGNPLQGEGENMA